MERVPNPWGRGAPRGGAGVWGGLGRGSGEAVAGGKVGWETEVKIFLQNFSKHSILMVHLAGQVS